jgi:hypothetical protein
MVALALCSRRWRRPALADAALASLLALAGAAAAGRAGGPGVPRAQNAWRALRDRWAEAVAARLVPDRLLWGACPDESEGDPDA